MGFENEPVLPEVDGQHWLALGAIERAVLPPERLVETEDRKSNGERLGRVQVAHVPWAFINRSSELP